MDDICDEADMSSVGVSCAHCKPSYLEVIDAQSDKLDRIVVALPQRDEALMKGVAERAMRYFPSNHGLLELRVAPVGAAPGGVPLFVEVLADGEESCGSHPLVELSERGAYQSSSGQSETLELPRPRGPGSKVI